MSSLRDPNIPLPQHILLAMHRKPALQSPPNVGVHRNPDTGSITKLERAPCVRALGAGEAKEVDSSRVLVCVTSVRKRLLDEDNLAEKYHVDCCRYAGLLHSDEPGQTKIEVSQRKTEAGETEHTKIKITYP